MERRFAARRDQILADAEVDPRILRGVLPRLERFLDPFLELLIMWSIGAAQKSAQYPAHHITQAVVF